MTDQPRKLSLPSAFTFVAEQDNWIAKLLVVLLFTALAGALVTVPLIVGMLPLIPADIMQQSLVPLFPALEGRVFAYDAGYLALIAVVLVGGMFAALLLGYYIEVVRRVRHDAEVLLPAWENWGVLFIDGIKMIGAYAGYLVSAAVLWLLVQGLLIGLVNLGQPLFAMLALICFFLPLLFAYGILVIFLTSINVVPFSESGRIRDFFDLRWTWHQARTHGTLTLNWFSLGVAANLGFSAVQSLPVVGVLGWVLSLAMSSPVQGHLLGQYAAILDERNAEQLVAEQIVKNL